MNFSQQLVDMLAVLLGFIDEENNLGRAPQPKTLDQFVADETCGGFQAGERFGSLGIVFQESLRRRARRAFRARREPP